MDGIGLHVGVCGLLITCKMKQRDLGEISWILMMQEIRLKLQKTGVILRYAKIMHCMYEVP